MNACRIVVAALALPLLPTGAGAQGLPDTDECISCHRTLEDSALAAPALTYADDVHALRGFGCLVCHGGPATARGSLDPATGFLSRPDRQEVPALCGRCHSDGAFMRDYNPAIRIDQVSEYYTSTHGQLLRDEDDPDVAVCVDCHPAHRIRPPSDPESSVHPLRVAELCGSCHADESLMQPRGLPTDQLEEFRESVHGELLFEEEDISSPTCNDCHGNHGAAPPEVASVRNVCGQCHSTMATFFDQSGHAEIFREEDLPGCATCHENHAIARTEDEDLVTRTRTVCRECHEADEPEGDALLAMAQLLDSLGAEQRRAEAVLEEAENLGMEVSQAIFELEEVNNALTMARTAIHSLQVGPVEEELAAGFAVTDVALERGAEALDEHRVRRVGLAASTATTLLLIIGLATLIRRLEKSDRPAAANAPERRE
jgi:predicted CXXCH cytochrome family protein